MCLLQVGAGLRLSSASRGREGENETRKYIDNQAGKHTGSGQNAASPPPTDVKTV